MQTLETSDAEHVLISGHVQTMQEPEEPEEPCPQAELTAEDKVTKLEVLGTGANRRNGLGQTVVKISKEY